MAEKNIHVDYNMQGNLLKNLGAPSGANDAARKDYVDTAVAGAALGLSWKAAVRAATTVAGTLATSFENGDTIDGVALATGNRILIKDQAAPEENGIYVVQASGTPLRATDADTAADVLQAAVFVQEGTVNADKLFVNTTNAPITLNTTGLVFAQFSSGGGGDAVLTDVYGSRPAPSNDGNLFLPNDGFSIQRDTGAIYTPWGPIFPLVEPDNTQFAWINQTSGGQSAAVAQQKGAIYFSTPKTSGNTLNIRVRKKAAPATPYIITAGFLFIGDIFGGGASSLVNECGLVWRESGSGELVCFMIGQVANFALRKWNSPTSFNSEYFNHSSSGWCWNHGALIWLRIADDGTNRIASISADGQNFIAVHTVGRTDFLTADEVGIFLRSDGDSAGSHGGIGMTLLSWDES